MVIDTNVKAISLFEKSLETVIARQTHDVPVWLQLIKQQALQRFETLGLPSRKMEVWRYFNLDPVLKVPFEPFAAKLHPSAPTTDVLRTYRLNHDLGGVLVFANGHFVPELSDTRDIPSDVVLLPLSEALRTHGDVLQRTLAQGLDQETDTFAQLNTGLFVDGALVYVPNNMQVDKPIQILNLTLGDDTDRPKAANPRVLVVAGKHAEVTVLNSYFGYDVKQNTLTNTVCELVLDENASVEYVHVQDESAKTVQMAATRGRLEANSRLKITTAAFGGKVSRHDMEIRMQGPGAECSLNGVAVLYDFMQNHDHVRVIHEVPHCQSSQLYKNIVSGHAISEFDGSILIHKAAQQTDARQLNRNLILSNDARAFTRPTLKIDADDVKCSHGATIGQLEEEEMFYLQSRGLSPELSRSILTNGFAGEVIDTVSVSAVRELLSEMLHRNLSTSRPLPSALEGEGGTVGEAKPSLTDPGEG